MKVFNLVFLICIYFSSNLYCQDNSLEISIEITGINNQQGNVGIALFRGEDGFPMGIERAKTTSFVAIQDSALIYSIKDISVGEYAICVFHDEDLNREINTNFIGMPKEGVGVSNNPKPRMGAPRYVDCKFHTDTTNRLMIKMRYIGQ
ncbi:MAG: DUF2141 domain-containing protein [Bacteroidales bacterium]